MKRVALFVGVDRYEDKAFRDLRYSVADAAALAAAFGRYGYETHVATNPGNRALLDEVERRTAGLGPGDVFVFFFAGHGYTGSGEEHLLICRDDRLQWLRYNRAGVPVDLLEDLTNGKGFHRAFLLDACRTDVFSGMEDRGGTETRDLGLVAMPDAGKYPGTCCVVRSCDRFCPALEFEDLGHGVFTRAVLDFLDGPEGRTVQMGEAFTGGVRERMRIILRREGSPVQQTPTFQSNGAAFALFGGTAGTGTVPDGAGVTGMSGTVWVECEVCHRNMEAERTYACPGCGKRHVCEGCRDGATGLCADCAGEEKRKRAAAGREDVFLRKAKVGKELEKWKGAALYEEEPKVLQEAEEAWAAAEEALKAGLLPDVVRWLDVLTESFGALERQVKARSERRSSIGIHVSELEKTLEGLRNGLSGLHVQEEEKKLEDQISCTLQHAHYCMGSSNWPDWLADTEKRLEVAQSELARLSEMVQVRRKESAQKRQEAARWARDEAAMRVLEEKWEKGWKRSRLKLDLRVALLSGAGVAVSCAAKAWTGQGGDWLLGAFVGMTVAVVVLVVRQCRQGKAMEKARTGEITDLLRSRDARRAGETRTITLPGGAEMEMAWCPPGVFWMGLAESEWKKSKWLCVGSYETLHRVTLTKGFWMAKTPVTQKQWRSVMGSTVEQLQPKAQDEANRTARERKAEPWPVPLCGCGDDYPMYYVTFGDCKQFCEKSGNGLQLPTEAQWEYACRADSAGVVGGPRQLKGMGWSSENSGGQMHPVRQKMPNAWGLYDMLGNVQEWCADLFQGDLGSSPATNPTGPEWRYPWEKKYIIRGGDFRSDPRTCRASWRCCVWVDTRDLLGFRPVLCDGEEYPPVAGETDPEPPGGGNAKQPEKKANLKTDGGHGNDCPGAKGGGMPGNTVLLEKVRKIIAEQLGTSRELVLPEARLEDFGADSLDGMELVMAFEEEFGVEIPDEDAVGIKTVGDVISYLQARGYGEK